MDAKTPAPPPRNPCCDYPEKSHLQALYISLSPCCLAMPSGPTIIGIITNQEIIDVTNDPRDEETNAVLDCASCPHPPTHPAKCTMHDAPEEVPLPESPFRTESPSRP